MKKIFTLIAIALINVAVFAQAPQKMSYQAVIRNTTDNLIANQLVGMKISILQGTSTGTAVYVETQTPTTNVNGLVSLEIGSGSVVSGTFSSINWSTGNYYIKTETDVTGGTSYTIAGTSQLLSVPYALYSGSSSGSLANGTAAGIMPHWNGTSWVTNNTNLYNNGGNIGLYTTTPTAQLELADIYSAGGKNLQIGDDTFLSDIDVPNVLGLYGVQNSDRAGIKLGSSGPVIWGQSNNIGIGTTSPAAKLDVAGTVKIADGTQGNGKVLTSDANGLATWSSPSTNAPYYHFTGKAFGQQMSFPVGDWGAMITLAMRENCVGSKTAGGMIYYDSTINVVSIINTTVPTSGYPASITASGNVLSLSNGCVPMTFTFTVNSGVVTITVGGDPGGVMESKWIVLGI